MKQWIGLFLIFTLSLALVGCSPADTYTIDSEADTFKPKTVVSITLAGPNSTDASGTSITLDQVMHTTDFQRLCELIQGKKLNECPTNAFLPGKITFTFESGKSTTVYPATDGSNYICLYSINPALAKYIELPPEDMKEVLAIMKKHGIDTEF